MGSVSSRCRLAASDSLASLGLAAVAQLARAPHITHAEVGGSNPSGGFDVHFFQNPVENMQIPYLDIDLKIALFLFSKGGEVVSFGAEQVEEITQFSVERYNLGKAFIEKLVAEYQGQNVALSEATVISAADLAISGCSDVEARLLQISSEFGSDFTAHGLMRDIVTAAIKTPAALLEIVNSYEPNSQGVAKTGIPGDFTPSTKAAASGTISWALEDQDEWAKIRELSGGGKGILVVVLDTGTTPGHEDLNEHAFTLSVVPNESSGVDANDHGTHCEGTACGKSPEIGVATSATVGSIQCLSGRGSGLSTWTAAAINLAIDKAIELKLPLVMSCSIGGGGPDAATTAALLRASRLWETHGIPAIFVAAGGNDGYQGRDNVNWPSKDVNACSVSPYQRSGLIAAFGSGGPAIDIAAPGQDITSASRHGGRVDFSGSSMATPYIAGAAALFQSFLRDHGFAMLRNTKEFIAFTAENATDMGAPGEDVRSGAGFLEIFQSLLSNKPDDVKSLALKASPIRNGLASFLICVAFAFSLAGSASAQVAQTVLSTVEVETITEVVERRLTSYGDMVLPVTEKVISAASSTSMAAKICFDPEGELPVGVSFLQLSGQLEEFESREDTANVGCFIVQAPPGVYLAISDFANGYQRVKRVTIEGTGPPVPDVDLSAIAPAAKRLADAMDDPGTAEILIRAYSTAAETGQGMTVEQAEAHTKQSILDIWDQRPQRSWFKDWVTGFQVPLQAQVDKIEMTTEVYLLVLKEVVKGLQESNSVSGQLAPPAPDCEYGNCPNLNR